MQLSIIIPAYNEEQRLPRTLSLLEAFVREGFAANGLRLHEIIVVDDGSVDGTSTLVRSWRSDIPLRLIRLEKNRGKGAASRAGMLAAEGDCCLLYDADAATPVSEIPKLIGRMCDYGSDVVIGSRVRGRRHNLVSMKWHRRLIGIVYHFFCSALIPGVDDAACGAKLFTREAAQDLFSRQRLDGFAFDVEVLSLAMRRGYTVCELPVRWEAVPGSKVNLVRDSLNMSCAVFGLYWRHMLLRNLGDPRTAPPTPCQAIQFLDNQNNRKAA
jgi:dolichyl-phosphate beta-glucosyltransferase